MVEIGLKLGSNEIVLTRKGQGIIAREPCVVALKIIGFLPIIKAVGNKAIELSKNDKNVVLYSPIQAGKITNIKYLSNLLKKMFSQYIVGNSFRLIVTVSVPSGYDIETLILLEKELYQAGANKVKFVQNALCARACISNLSDDDISMVVDIGKYITDIVVLNGKKIFSGRTYEIGGEDINKNIIDFVFDNFGLKIDNYVAEKLKIELSTLYKYDNNSISFYGINKDGKLQKANITSSSIQLTLKNTIDDILSLIDLYISNMPDETKKQIKRNGILFVGGVTNISGFLEYAKEKISYPIFTGEIGENVIANGLDKIVKSGANFYIDW